MIADIAFHKLPVDERQAILERLALTLERNATWAAEEGDAALEMVMQSIGTALLLVAGDLAVSDIELAQDSGARAQPDYHLSLPQSGAPGKT